MQALQSHKLYLKGLCFSLPGQYGLKRAMSNGQKVSPGPKHFGYLHLFGRMWKLLQKTYASPRLLLAQTGYWDKAPMAWYVSPLQLQLFIAMAGAATCTHRFELTCMTAISSFELKKVSASCTHISAAHVIIIVQPVIEVVGDGLTLAPSQ